jgi:hypothetical protein
VCEKLRWMLGKLEFSGRMKLNRLTKCSFDGTRSESSQQFLPLYLQPDYSQTFVVTL